MELCELRGRVISRFSEVEGIVCNLITAQIHGDLRNDNQEFRLSLIFDPKIRFFNKIEQFEALCKDQTRFIRLKNQASEEKFSKLRDLANLRNFFAHARDLIDSDGQFKLYVVDGRKQVTSDTKLIEFNKIADEIIPILRMAQMEIPYFKNFNKPTAGTSVSGTKATT